MGDFEVLLGDVRAETENFISQDGSQDYNIVVKPNLYVEIGGTSEQINESANYVFEVYLAIPPGVEAYQSTESSCISPIEGFLTLYPSEVDQYNEGQALYDLDIESRFSSIVEQLNESYQDPYSPIFLESKFFGIDLYAYNYSDGSMIIYGPNYLPGGLSPQNTQDAIGSLHTTTWKYFVDPSIAENESISEGSSKEIWYDYSFEGESIAYNDSSGTEIHRLKEIKYELASLVEENIYGEKIKYTIAVSPTDTVASGVLDIPHAFLAGEEASNDSNSTGELLIGEYLYSEPVEQRSVAERAELEEEDRLEAIVTQENYAIGESFHYRQALNGSAEQETKSRDKPRITFLVRLKAIDAVQVSVINGRQPYEKSYLSSYAAEQVSCPYGKLSLEEEKFPERELSAEVAVQENYGLVEEICGGKHGSFISETTRLRGESTQYTYGIESHLRQIQELDGVSGQDTYGECSGFAPIMSIRGIDAVHSTEAYTAKNIIRRISVNAFGDSFLASEDITGIYQIYVDEDTNLSISSGSSQSTSAEATGLDLNEVLRGEVSNGNYAFGRVITQISIGGIASHSFGSTASTFDVNSYLYGTAIQYNRASIASISKESWLDGNVTQNSLSEATTFRADTGLIGFSDQSISASGSGFLEYTNIYGASEHESYGEASHVQNIVYSLTGKGINLNDASGTRLVNEVSLRGDYANIPVDLGIESLPKTLASYESGIGPVQIRGISQVEPSQSSEPLGEIEAWPALIASESVQNNSSEGTLGIEFKIYGEEAANETSANSHVLKEIVNIVGDSENESLCSAKLSRIVKINGREVLQETLSSGSLHYEYLYGTIAERESYAVGLLSKTTLGDIRCPSITILDKCF